MINFRQCHAVEVEGVRALLDVCQNNPTITHLQLGHLWAKCGAEMHQMVGDINDRRDEKDQHKLAVWGLEAGDAGFFFDEDEVMWPMKLV
jgi:hypothetical protein